MKEKAIGKMYIECFGFAAKGKQAQRIERYRDPRLGGVGGSVTQKKNVIFFNFIFVLLLFCGIDIYTVYIYI